MACMPGEIQGWFADVLIPNLKVACVLLGWNVDTTDSRWHKSDELAL